MRNWVIWIFLVSILALSAQKVVESDVSFKGVSSKNINLCIDAYHTYLLQRKTSEKYHLEILDSLLRKVSSHEIDFQNSSYVDAKVFAFEIIKQKPTIFVKATDKKTKIDVFWAMVVDLKEPQQVFQAVEMNSQYKRAYKKLEHRNIVVSRKGDLFFMIQSSDPYKTKGEREMLVAAYDTNFTLLYDVDMSSEEDLDLRSIQFDSKGNFYLLVASEKENEAHVSQTFYTVRQFLRLQNEFKTYILDVPEVNLNSTKFIITSKDELIGSAYYGIHNKDDLDGIVHFFLKKDKQGYKLMIKEKLALSDNFKRNFLAEKDLKHKVSLKNYKISNVLMLDDTTFVTVGEYLDELKWKWTAGGGASVSGGGAGGGVTSVHNGARGLDPGTPDPVPANYTRNHLIIHQSSIKGVLDTIMYIPKLQKGNIYTSIKTFTKNKEEHLLFNQLAIYKDLFLLKPKDMGSFYTYKIEKFVLMDCMLSKKGISYQVIDQFRGKKKLNIKNGFDDLFHKENIFLYQSTKQKQFSLVRVEY